MPIQARKSPLRCQFCGRTDEQLCGGWYDEEFCAYCWELYEAITKWLSPKASPNPHPTPPRLLRLVREALKRHAAAGGVR